MHPPSTRATRPPWATTTPPATCHQDPDRLDPGRHAAPPPAAATPTRHHLHPRHRHGRDRLLTRPPTPTHQPRRPRPDLRRQRQPHPPRAPRRGTAASPGTPRTGSPPSTTHPTAPAATPPPTPTTTPAPCASEDKGARHLLRQPLAHLHQQHPHQDTSTPRAAAWPPTPAARHLDLPPPRRRRQHQPRHHHERRPSPSTWSTSPTAKPGSTRATPPPPPTGFNGEYTDPRGLADLGQRWYDAKHQLFYSPDPATTDDPANLLTDPRLTNSYTLNHHNSYTYTDPDGRMPEPVLNTATGLASVGKSRAQFVSWSARPERSAAAQSTFPTTSRQTPA